MANKFIVTPAYLAAVAALDKAEGGLVKATLKLCDLWKAEGVTEAHFSRPTGDKAKDNAHVAAYAFLAELAARTVSVGKVKLDDDGVKRYLDKEVGPAAIIRGIQKAGTHPQGATWNNAVVSKLGKWRKAFAAYSAEESAKAGGAPKTPKSDAETALDALQRIYTKAFKEGAGFYDVAELQAALGKAAFAITGKEGALKKPAK